MNSAQIGAAVCPPANPRSRLSSKPIQITVTRFDVKPENQPSREVPVFPAAGKLNPRARTVAPVPLFNTSFNRLVTKYATRGSSTLCVSGVVFSSIVPLELTTSCRNCGSPPPPLSAPAARHAAPPPRRVLARARSPARRGLYFFSQPHLPRDLPPPAVTDQLSDLHRGHV